MRLCGRVRVEVNRKQTLSLSRCHVCGDRHGAGTLADAGKAGVGREATIASTHSTVDVGMLLSRP